MKFPSATRRRSIETSTLSGEATFLCQLIQGFLKLFPLGIFVIKNENLLSAN